MDHSNRSRRYDSRADGGCDMATEKINILIIDEDKERMEFLRSFMPLYTNVKTVTYGDMAKNAIREGEINFIIMYADDSRGQSLYMFGWIKQNVQFANIPILLMIQDEFSDRALDFLEEGEATFYEGEPEPFAIFSIMTQMLQEAEDREFREQISRDIERLSFEKPSGWVMSGEGIAGIRAALEAQMQRDDDNELTRAMNKAYAFAATVHTTHVKDRPQQAQTVEDNYKFQQLKKSLARGERKMEELKAAIAAMLLEKEKRREERLRQEVPLKKILVADDDAIVRKAIKNYLQDNYDVTVVNSGSQAIDYIIQYKTDMLILDYCLPMLDGIKTLQSIRFQPNGMHIPVLFLTARADKETVQKCIQAGAQGIISKPFSRELLRSSIDAVLV